MASQRPQCSSVLQTVLLEDIRPLLTTHIRRNSCQCEACGGERLAYLLRSTALPLATTSSSPKPRLICRPRRLALKGTGEGTDPATPLYRPPPATPALCQLLRSLTAKQASKPCSRSSQRLIHTATKLKRIPSYCLPTGLSTGRMRKRSYGN